jgi:hypothetical protein
VNSSKKLSFFVIDASAKKAAVFFHGSATLVSKARRLSTYPGRKILQISKNSRGTNTLAYFGTLSVGISFISKLFS